MLWIRNNKSRRAVIKLEGKNGLNLLLLLFKAKKKYRESVSHTHDIVTSFCFVIANWLHLFLSRRKQFESIR